MCFHLSIALSLSCNPHFVRVNEHSYCYYSSRTSSIHSCYPHIIHPCCLLVFVRSIDYSLSHRFFWNRPFHSRVKFSNVYSSALSLRPCFFKIFHSLPWSFRSSLFPLIQPLRCRCSGSVIFRMLTHRNDLERTSQQ